MKCYLCKKEIEQSWRLFVAARNYRERDKFRDVCETCYKESRERNGFTLGEFGWERINRDKDKTSEDGE